MERIETRKMAQPLTKLVTKLLAKRVTKLGMVFLISFVFSNSDYTGSLACAKQKNTGISGTIGGSCCGRSSQKKQTCSKEYLKTIETILNKKFKDISTKLVDFDYRYEALSCSKIPGLILVRSTNQKNGRMEFHFTDHEVKYLFNGMVLNIETITDQMVVEAKPYKKIVNKVNLWSSLPRNRAMKHGSGDNEFAVIIGLNCPYCKKLVNKIGKLKNIYAEILILPEMESDIEYIEYLTQSWRPLKFIIKYFDGDPLNFHYKVKKGYLTNHFKQLFNLVQKYQFHGFPVIIRPDGEYKLGADNLDTLQHWVEEGNK